MKGTQFFCTFHYAEFLLQCMVVNLHVVIGCHCAVKRDCTYHVLTPLPINNVAQVKIDLQFFNHSQSCETGNEPFDPSMPSLLVNV